jgi:hypothetical protein
MRCPGDGLAAIGYAPCEVQTKVASGPVELLVETGYPFRQDVNIQIKGAGSFPLWLRIPGWAEGSTVIVDGQTVVVPKCGEFLVLDRDWNGEHQVELHLGMKIKLEKRCNDAVSIHRGPLVYSLRIDEFWRRIRGEEPHADWEMYPTTVWNYGVLVDEASPEKSIRFEEREIGDFPFSPDGAPLLAVLKGRQIPYWVLERNAAGIPPVSPVQSDTPLVELEMIPYGCTNLRVTEIPWLVE